MEPFVLAEVMMELVVTNELTRRLDAIFDDLETLDYRMIRAYVNENAIVVDAVVILDEPVDNLTATPTPEMTATPAG